MAIKILWHVLALWQVSQAGHARNGFNGALANNFIRPATNDSYAFRHFADSYVDAWFIYIPLIHLSRPVRVR
jgi:hypothetical protein